MPLLIIAGIVWIVLALMTNVLPAEGFWAARRLANAAITAAVRLSGREAWRATAQTAQAEGSAGLIPAVGFLASALALWCWARRVRIAMLLRVIAATWFLGVAVATLLGHVAMTSDPRAPWAGALSFGLAFMAFAEVLDPKMTAGRPKRQVVELSGSVGAVGSLTARPTFHSDVMDRLARRR
jgi:hypothetical protein